LLIVFMRSHHIGTVKAGHMPGPVIDTQHTMQRPKSHGKSEHHQPTASDRKGDCRRERRVKPIKGLTSSEEQDRGEQLRFHSRIVRCRAIRFSELD